MTAYDNEDPIALYIVIREGLDMGAGKVGAQCSHATKSFLVSFFKLEIAAARKDFQNVLSESLKDHLATTTKWLGNGSRVCVLSANEEEWEKIQAEYGRELFLIRDSGLTEVKPGTETVFCLWPQHKSARSDTLRSCRALK